VKTSTGFFLSSPEYPREFYPATFTPDLSRPPHMGKPPKNPTPEWSLAQAQRDFEKSVMAAARRAIVGADDAQAKQFNEELRLLMDNIKELFPGGASLTTV